MVKPLQYWRGRGLIGTHNFAGDGKEKNVQHRSDIGFLVYSGLNFVHGDIELIVEVPSLVI